MKIPKYVQKIIDRRWKLAEELNDVSTKLDEWLENNGIPICNDYTTTGCMIYCEPYNAKRCVEADILNKE